MIRKCFNKLRSKLIGEVIREQHQVRSMLGQNSILLMRLLNEKLNELSDASLKVYSQWGEDGIIDFICERLNLKKPMVIEFGVGNFDECNSRFLAEFRGASVIAVDGRNDLITNIDKLGIRLKAKIDPIETWITPEEANKIMNNAKKEIGSIDIISIDIDGNDYYVMEALNLENIEVVIVEYNPFLGYKKSIAIPRNDNFVREEKGLHQDYYGASLRAWVNLLAKRNFILLGCNLQNTNAFFIKKSRKDFFNFVAHKDLSKYTECLVRDYRDEESKFNYISYYERQLNLIGMNFFDTELKQIIEFNKNFI